MDDYIQLFEDRKIRTTWDEEQLANYLGTNCPQVAMVGSTGKKRKESGQVLFYADEPYPGGR